MQRGDRVVVKILTGLFESFWFVGCRRYSELLAVGTGRGWRGSMAIAEIVEKYDFYFSNWHETRTRFARLDVF
jgi:hypothetical protein